MATKATKKGALAISLDVQAQLDPRSLKQVRQQIGAISQDRVNLGLDVRQMEDLAKVASKVQRAFLNAGHEQSKSMDDFESSFNKLLQAHDVAQKAYSQAISDGNETVAETQLQQIKNIEKAFQGLANFTEAKLEFTPTTQSVAKFGKTSADAFVAGLDKLKAGDLEGLAKGLFGGAAKMAQRGSSAVAGAAEARSVTGGAGAGAGLAAVAKTLGSVAVALAGVSAAVGVILALFIAADNKNKELNKTLLESGGIADWSFGKAADAVEGLDDQLDAARDAARETAQEFGGDTEEYTRALSSLQAGGFTFKEMTAEGRTFDDTLKGLIVSGRAVGITLAESAQYAAEFQETFGLGQEQIAERFLTIASAASMSSMGTKRFFTAVSQATSGMALYNVRMEEAAGLLSLTSKILGGADASEFIKSLTKGFTEESYEESAKRIMIAGGKVMGGVFSGEVARASEAFVKDFAAQQALLGSAITASGVDIQAQAFLDPKTLAQTLGKMADKDRQAIVYQLQETGTDAGRAMALQITQLERLLTATKGGLDAQVVGLEELGMQGKLALMFQRLGDENMTRISDLSLQQLMKYSQTSGLSRDQIRKLSLIEDSLRAQFALQGEDGQTFTEWLATGDLTNLKLDEQLEDAKSAEDYAREIASQTITMGEWLGKIYEDFLDVLGDILDGIWTLAGRWGGPDHFADARIGGMEMTERLEINQMAQEDARSRLDSDPKAEAELVRLIEDAEILAKGLDPKLYRKLHGEDVRQAKEDLKKRPKDVEKGTLEALQQYDTENMAYALASATGVDFVTALADVNSGNFGNYWDTLQANPDLREQAAKMGGSGIPPAANDFVMRPGQGAQRFSSRDTLVGLKPGGPLDNALRGGGGGTTIININGGDMSAVYNTVRTAMKTSRR